MTSGRRFSETLEGPGLAASTWSRPSSVDALEALLDELPTASSVIGLGGGQAIDVAKFIAWRRRLPLFQVPTAMTVNAPFGHRSGLRRDGIVRYLGFAIPEAVYVDFDVIASAPAGLNRAGVGDILCYHTAHLDWRLTRDLGKDSSGSGRTTRGSSQPGARAARFGARCARCHPRRDRPRDPHADGGASLGRHDVPRLGLEPAPHRGRRALLLLQPREADRSALHPRAAGRARDRARVGAARTPGPTRWSPRCIAPASTSGPRRWA